MQGFAWPSCFDRIQPMHTRPSQLIRQARIKAGLTRSALARRARVSPAALMRIERSLSNPRWKTVRRLLAAAGFDFHVELIARPILGARLRKGVARILSMTPEQRLEEVRLESSRH